MQNLVEYNYTKIDKEEVRCIYLQIGHFLRFKGFPGKKLDGLQVETKWNGHQGLLF